MNYKNKKSKFGKMVLDLFEEKIKENPDIFFKDETGIISGLFLDNMYSYYGLYEGDFFSGIVPVGDIFIGARFYEFSFLEKVRFYFLLKKLRKVNKNI